MTPLWLLAVWVAAAAVSATPTYQQVQARRQLAPDQYPVPSAPSPPARQPWEHFDVFWRDHLIEFLVRKV